MKLSEYTYPSDYGAGSGGDMLSEHSGAAFSTIDRDNDVYAQNCAEKFKGAWWYTDCHSSNLNGHNYGSVKTPYATGIVWKSFTTYFYSLKSDVMAIRPMNA